MATTTTLNNVFTSGEAAEYLGLHDSLVRRYCREAKIKATKLGRTWHIRKGDLDKFSKKARPVGNPNFRQL
jgi:excisionase family DNA binding protein